MTWPTPLGAESDAFRWCSWRVDEPPLLAAASLTAPRARRGMARRLRLEHAREVGADAELTLVGARALALENAELKAALRESRRELVDARARIIGASRPSASQPRARPPRRRSAAVDSDPDRASDCPRVCLDEDLAGQLESISVDAELAVDELRALARGIYPAVLRDHGLGAAVRSLAIRGPIPVGVVDKRIGRYSAVVEAAVYFCVSEAVQNAIKHAGPDARVTVVLGRGPPGGHPV